MLQYICIYLVPLCWIEFYRSWSRKCRELYKVIFKIIMILDFDLKKQLEEKLDITRKNKGFEKKRI